MPHVGLRTEDGKIRKTWEQIDPSLDFKTFYPSTPGLLQFIKSDGLYGRQDVEPVNMVSASEAGYGARRLWLQSVFDYYTTVRQNIGGAMGTKAHDIIEKGPKPNQICEMRLTVGTLTAKNDLYDIPSKILEDLKHIGWYKLKNILTKGMTHRDGGLDYALQVNLWRILAWTDEGLAQIQKVYPDVARDDFKVQNMYLTVIPRDLTGSNKKEAMGTKGLVNPWCVPITVPFLDSKQVVKSYLDLHAAKMKAVETGFAPLCTPEERWERNGGYPAMCVEYCPVVEECIMMERQRNGSKSHPADVWAWKKFNRPHVLEVK